MPSIVADELEHLTFEVWLLHEQQPVLEQGEERQNTIEIGRHGLVIQQGHARGLLLPGVATDHGFDAPTFLQQVCLKAGLPPTAWKDDHTQLWTFEGVAVRGDFDATSRFTTAQSPLRFATHEVEHLAAFCRDNIVAVSRGAVPNYYMPAVSDGAVQGVNVAVKLQSTEVMHLAQVGLRQALPLQSTLFQISEAAGQQLSSNRLQPGASDLQVDLAILYEPAVQGTVGRARLGWIRPAAPSPVCRSRQPIGLAV